MTNTIDSWGDEGVWEIVEDFRELNEIGVSAEEVLLSLRKIDGNSAFARGTST